MSAHPPSRSATVLDGRVAVLQRLITQGEARRLGRLSDLHVRNLRVGETQITADVDGTSGAYEVRVTFTPRPGHHCTCPDWQRNGRRVGPCKHVLRVASDGIKVLDSAVLKVAPEPVGDERSVRDWKWRTRDWDEARSELPFKSARRTAALVRTDTATIYAISPERLHEIVQEGVWGVMADALWGATGALSDPTREMNHVIRQHGGAVFFIGRDGFWNVDVPAARIEYKYVNPKGPKYLRGAARVASAYEGREILRAAAAALLAGGEVLVSGEDLADLVDTEYRDRYGRPATREEVAGVLASLAEEAATSPSGDWPRNLWVDALVEAYGIPMGQVLDLPDEDQEHLVDLWAAYEMAEDSGQADEAMDAFFVAADQVLSGNGPKVRA